MSRYKDHRGPSRRGYDEDYTADRPRDRAAAGLFQPEAEAGTSTPSRSKLRSNGSMRTRGSGLFLSQANPMRSCPHGR